MNTVRIVKKANLFIITSLLLVMSGCTLNEGDPQTTLCKKLTAHLMPADGKIVWNKSTKESTSGEQLHVSVGFNHADGNVTKAVCIYGLNNRDEGEEYEVDPDKFINIPDSMLINDQSVRTQDLQTALQKVAAQSVKDTFSEENITQKANDAANVVKEGTIKIKNVATDTAEDLKKGAEQAKNLMGDATKKAGELLEKAGEKLQE